MADQGPYPPRHLSRLVRRIEAARELGVHRSWTGNDRSARNHHGVVLVDESPLRLRLSWKRGPKEHVNLIGVYELDLRKLLAEGYVRLEPGSRKEIRLRFFHSEDGRISIQVNLRGPAVSVGEMG